MTILLYRYGSICEPAIIRAFEQHDITIVEESTEIIDKQITASQRIEKIHNLINKHHPLFVFSINFFPSIAEVCHLHNTLYLCWTVDSPVPELFSGTLTYKTNRIFMFDRAQYEYFSPFNPDCIHHLPLASDAEHFTSVNDTITVNERRQYAHDISFIGSLYNEKNPLNKLSLPPYMQGYINGMVNASLKVYGYNFLEELVNIDVVESLKTAGANFFEPDKPVTSPDYYIAAHSFIGYQVAETERIQTLNALARYFSVDLYTHSNTSALENVNIHGGVKTLTEMPKVFHLSRINLNMTIKPIQTGLPLRIFDIMGCCGFLMTNYQAELTDLFEIGVDLEAYSSLEELIDKCAFYLAHEDERAKIALKGYEKVKKYHTYQHRIAEMLGRIV